MPFHSDCNTWAEINAQPAIWRDWASPLEAQAAELAGWIVDTGIRHIWFCGAGTSAFIGDALAATAHPRLSLRSVPTTDLVAAPQDFLPPPDDLLVVQFGRSGDSSESVGVMDLLDTHAPQVHQLNITCNPNGALAKRPAPGPGLRKVLALPEATHDSGFAMTSSFTTMLLSALAVLDGGQVIGRITRLANAADDILPALANLPTPRPARAIFLGSGPLKGIARESALKTLELTAGQTMCQWDSTLGFRHGPKAAIGPDTHVSVMVHPDAHTARYDRDVAEEIRRQYPDAVVETIGDDGCDMVLPLTGDARWDAVLYVLAAQVRAVMWSAELGLPIDNPFAGQDSLSRVVTGVTLYEYEAQ
ncbi:SIS domain-containing protein [Tropicimonas marinistellae]|uniref:SIS domain-containing protein n=1 Tax=Tropicimonas marinistellae TaxID=1739787 RepID=UPI00083072DB|nr:SIS domain-containing protein [Tropicimonas marinistellae]